MCLCIAGLNCAEAVNFGPPDWLPWGHYVGNKYRKDAKAATLSNDALLVNLAKAAPLVQKRLAEVRVALACSQSLTASGLLQKMSMTGSSCM